MHNFIYSNSKEFNISYLSVFYESETFFYEKFNKKALVQIIDVSIRNISID